MEEISKKLKQWEGEDDGRGYLLVVIDKKKNSAKTEIKMAKEYLAMAMMSIRMAIEEVPKKGRLRTNR